MTEDLGRSTRDHRDRWCLMSAFSVQTSAWECRGCIGLTRRPLRHLVGALLFAAMISLVSMVGIVEGANGSAIYVAFIVGVCLLSVVLVYGVEIDHVRYGDFELRFSDGDDDD